MEEMKKVILKIKSGSSLYGTRTEDSDTDYIGVFIPNDDYIVGLERIEQLQENVVSKKDNGKNNKDAVDCTYYELRKFLNLCLQGNPNIFEVLFVNEENIVEITEEGRELLKLRDKFISQKVINNTYGFINSMVRKLDSRVETLTSLNNLLYRIDLACETTGIDITEPIAKIEDYLKDIIQVSKYQYIVGKYQLNRNATINNAKKQIEDIIKNKTNRKELVDKYGYDTKSAYHIARLYYQMIEILAERQIIYPLAKANDLLKIKTGALPYHLFLLLIEDLRDTCVELEEIHKLPSKPNYNVINDYCKKTLIGSLT